MSVCKVIAGSLTEWEKGGGGRKGEQVQLEKDWKEGGTEHKKSRMKSR